MINGAVVIATALFQKCCALHEVKLLHGYESQHIATAAPLSCLKCSVQAAFACTCISVCGAAAVLTRGVRPQRRDKSVRFQQPGRGRHGCGAGRVPAAGGGGIGGRARVVAGARRARRRRARRGTAPPAQSSPRLLHNSRRSAACLCRCCAQRWGGACRWNPLRAVLNRDVRHESCTEGPCKQA